ncbi:MAG: EamA family transporter [Acidobacteriota bacterium]
MGWLAWSFLSALFAAATAILAKLGVTGIDSNLATAVRTSVVLVFAWAIVLTTGGAPKLGLISNRGWLFLVLSGFATGLSWLCYFRALQLGPASKVAPVDKLSMVLVLAGAAVFLGESISIRTGLGAAMILGGVYVLASG